MMDLGVEAPRLGGVLVGMALIVGAVEGERAEGLELALDEVQPARIGRGEDELDVVLGDPRPELGLLVRAEVVEDDDQVLAEASPERARELPNLAPGLAVVEVAVQRTGGGIVGGHELAHAGRSRVRARKRAGFVSGYANCCRFCASLALPSARRGRGAAIESAKPDAGLIRQEVAWRDDDREGLLAVPLHRPVPDARRADAP
jgi:hypothetical protein